MITQTANNNNNNKITIIMMFFEMTIIIIVTMTMTTMTIHVVLYHHSNASFPDQFHICYYSGMLLSLSIMMENIIVCLSLSVFFP
mmetsp:Transcript_19006/g.44279  ORF Transcript_19006/g.44279 Transcript_19006/m.44279 type:complete len:85 (-) Transcript_19006:422-676(-)